MRSHGATLPSGHVDQIEIPPSIAGALCEQRALSFGACPQRLKPNTQVTTSAVPAACPRMNEEICPELEFPGIPRERV